MVAVQILFKHFCVYLFLAVLGPHGCVDAPSLQGAGCRAQAAHRGGFSGCGAWALGCSGVSISVSQALERGLRNMVLSCPTASSWTRDRTSLPFIGRRILNHWTTRDVPQIF